MQGDRCVCVCVCACALADPDPNWGTNPPSLLLSFPTFPSLLLEVGPVNTARGSGGALPQ